MVENQIKFNQASVHKHRSTKTNLNKETITVSDHNERHHTVQSNSSASTAYAAIPLELVTDFVSACACVCERALFTSPLLCDAGE